ATNDVNITTQSKAQNLLTVLDNALTSLKTKRSSLAGLHDRLDVSAAHNLILSESMDGARSKIEDADFALETAELVRNQILAQGQVAVLAQANVQMKTALDLLQGIER